MAKIDKPLKGKTKGPEDKENLKEEGQREAPPVAEVKSKKGLASGVKKIFKKKKNAS